MNNSRLTISSSTTRSTATVDNPVPKATWSLQRQGRARLSEPKRQHEHGHEAHRADAVDLGEGDALEAAQERPPSQDAQAVDRAEAGDVGE